MEDTVDARLAAAVAAKSGKRMCFHDKGTAFSFVLSLQAACCRFFDCDISHLMNDFEKPAKCTEKSEHVKTAEICY